MSMKINSYYKTSFKAHLTPEFKERIRTSNPEQISKELAKQGIETDFAGNRNFAVCNQQAVEIFKTLNVGLPKGIYVMNIPELEADKGSFSHAVSNTRKEVFYKDDGFKNLDYVDKMMTMSRKHKLVPSDNFLSIFLHEFSHIANFDNMDGKTQYSLPETVQKFKEIPVPIGLRHYILYHDKYFIPYQNCNMMEVFAYTMENRLGECLDEKTLRPKYNPFENLYTQHRRTRENVAFDDLMTGIYEGDLKRVKKTIRKFY